MLIHSFKLPLKKCIFYVPSIASRPQLISMLSSPEAQSEQLLRVQQENNRLLDWIWIKIGRNSNVEIDNDTKRTFEVV